MPDPLVRDSVTHLPERAEGRVALCASHGGTYAAWYALARGVAALILHDAGLGRDRAGVAGLGWLAGFGVPAAAVGHLTARIGDGADCLARGVLSVVNEPAQRLGLAPGMGAASALSRLAAAPPPMPHAVPPMREARAEIAGAGRGGILVLALDSNGLVAADDAGHIVVTGSHGGLLGGRPETAVKHPVRAAVFNDAGIGIDRAGLSRLPALEARGIAGLTVSAMSARIGEAMSTWSDGIVSAANGTARTLGARPGQTCREAIAALLDASLATSAEP